MEQGECPKLAWLDSDYNNSVGFATTLLFWHRLYDIVFFLLIIIISKKAEKRTPIHMIRSCIQSLTGRPLAVTSVRRACSLTVTRRDHNPIHFPKCSPMTVIGVSPVNADAVVRYYTVARPGIPSRVVVASGAGNGPLAH